MKLLKIIIPVLSLFLFSCDEGGLLIETDISNENVVLLAPSDNVEVALNSLIFDWQEIEDATHYEIQIATPDFENTQQLLLNVIDTITFYEQTLAVGEYQWRVKAKNSSYETAYTTASFSVVSVEDFSTNTIVLTTPEGNLITNNTDQTLSWEPINGATLYRIQVIENGSVIDEQTITSATLDYTFLEGSFTWQVRAENGTENTLYFSREVLIDLSTPNIPLLTSPEDGSELSSDNVSFEWTRELIEGSQEFDSIYVYRDSNLTDLVVKDRSTSPFSQTLINDTYYWKVKSFDQAGNESEDSSLFSFTVNQ